MRRLSSSEEERVIEMWFDGYTREYIATTLGIGETTVFDIIKTLPPSLRLARDIAVAYRKHNLAMSDALKGLGVIIQLNDIDVKPEQLQSFIQTFKKMCTDAQYQPSRIIEAGMRLSAIESESGKTYNVAITEFQAALKSKEELDKENQKRTDENSQLKLEIQENRRLRDEALEKAGTTEQELSEFQSCKVAFRQYGMDINDAGIIRKVFDAIKEMDRSPRHMVSLVKRFGSLSRVVALFERQLPIMREEYASLLSHTRDERQNIANLRGEQEQLKNHIIWQRNEITNNDNKLNQTRLNLEQLDRVREATIEWIGKARNWQPQQIENLKIDSQREIRQIALQNAFNQYKRMLAARYNAFIDVLRSSYGA